jgi:GNAT superfamily N-acetyltransferase
MDHGSIEQPSFSSASGCQLDWGIESMTTDWRAFDLTDIRARGNVFRFKAAKDCPVKSPLPIPFGSVTDPDGYRFLVRTSDNGLEELVAIPEESTDSSTEVRILPVYTAKAKIDNQEFGTLDLEVWQVATDVHRLQAAQIILRSHYLSPPTRGMILGCRFASTEDQERIRSRRREGQPADAEAGDQQEDVNRMVACAVLDTLFHSQPRGRRELARQEGYNELFDKWDKKDTNGKRIVTRKMAVQQLKIGYASRFAVDEPYRGIGIGTTLARCLVEVAALRHVPQLQYVEVITTRPAEGPGAIRPDGETNQGDFLEQAGYIRVKESLPSRPLLHVDLEKYTIDRTPTKKFYYYARTQLR